MVTKFPLWLFRHPLVSLLVLVCFALGISRWVQTATGNKGLLRAKKICWISFIACLFLLLLDGIVAWYSAKQNPDGYGLIYPIAVALLVSPLAVTCAFLAIVFTYSASKSREGPAKKSER